MNLIETLGMSTSGREYVYADVCCPSVHAISTDDLYRLILVAVPPHV